MQSGLRTRHHEPVDASEGSHGGGSGGDHQAHDGGYTPLHGGSHRSRSGSEEAGSEHEHAHQPPFLARAAAWARRLESVAGGPLWSPAGIARLLQAGAAAARRSAAGGWDTGAASFGLVMAASAAMNTLFVTYYLDLFLNIVHVTPGGFYAGQLVFMAWNAVNDPVLGWLSDRFVGSADKSSGGNEGAGRRGSSIGSGQTVEVLAADDAGPSALAAAAQAQTHLSRLYRRVAAIRIGGAAWGVAFSLLWWPWVFLPHGSDGSSAVVGWGASFLAGLHFTLALCAYDGCLTYVEVNHSALLSELSSDVGVRARATAWAAVCAAAGSLTSFLGYLLWPRAGEGSEAERRNPSVSLHAFRGMTLVIALCAIVAFEVAGRGVTSAAVKEVRGRGLRVVYYDDDEEEDKHSQGEAGEGDSGSAPPSPRAALVLPLCEEEGAPPSDDSHGALSPTTTAATSNVATAPIQWPGASATARAVAAWATRHARRALHEAKAAVAPSKRHARSPNSSSPRFDFTALFTYWRFLGRLVRQRNFLIFVVLSTLQSFDCTFQKNSFAPFMDTLTGSGEGGHYGAMKGGSVVAAVNQYGGAKLTMTGSSGGFVTGADRGSSSGAAPEGPHSHHRPADDKPWALPGGPGARKLLAKTTRNRRKGSSLLGRLIREGLGDALGQQGGGEGAEDFDALVRAAAAAAGVGDTAPQQDELFKGRPAPKRLPGWGEVQDDAAAARRVPPQQWRPEPPRVALERGQELPPAARAAVEEARDALLGLRRMVDFEDDPGLDGRDQDDDDHAGGGGKKAAGHRGAGHGGGGGEAHGHGHAQLLDKLLRDGGRSLEQAEADTKHGQPAPPPGAAPQRAGAAGAALPQQPGQGKGKAVSGIRLPSSLTPAPPDTPLSATLRGAIISLSFFAPHCLTVLWAPLVRAQGVAATLSQVFTLRLVILMAGLALGRLSSSLAVALYMLLNRTTSESVCRLFPLVISDVVDEHSYIAAGGARRRRGRGGSSSSSSGGEGTADVAVAIDDTNGGGDAAGPQAPGDASPRLSATDEEDDDESTYLIDYSGLKRTCAAALPAPLVAGLRKLGLGLAGAVRRSCPSRSAAASSSAAPGAAGAGGGELTVASASIVGSATCVAKLSQSLAPMLTYSLLSSSSASSTALPDRIWSMLVWVSLLVVMAQSTLWVTGFTLQGSHLEAVKAWARRGTGSNSGADDGGGGPKGERAGEEVEGGGDRNQ